jgi:hypothetical protein
MNRTYISSLDHLRSLPAVFRLSTLAKMMNVTPDAASVYINRWKRNGMVAAAGPRVGIYYNLVIDRDAKENHQHTAILMEYPSAVLRGASVLHAHGWITQIPQQLEIAALTRASYPAMDGVSVFPRPQSWYQAVHHVIQNGRDAIHGLPALHPAWALADLFLTDEDWHPDIDDLDLNDEDWTQVATAFVELGINPPEQYATYMGPGLQQANRNESLRRHYE